MYLQNAAGAYSPGVGETPVAFDDKNSLCLVLTAFCTIREEKITREIRIINVGLTLTLLLSLLFFNDEGMIILSYMRKVVGVKGNLQFTIINFHSNSNSLISD
jgi:hypothetical protein